MLLYRAKTIQDWDETLYVESWSPRIIYARQVLFISIPSAIIERQIKKSIGEKTEENCKEIAKKLSHLDNF